MKKYFIVFGFCLGSIIGFSQTGTYVKTNELVTEKPITKKIENTTIKASEGSSEKKVTTQTKEYTNTLITVESERPLPTPVKPTATTPVVDPKSN